MGYSKRETGSVTSQAAPGTVMLLAQLTV
ncbi:hypothetical protein BCEP4_100068 [Burkholderia cepacia]|nr:hypothetical protein BCEP4_100068 [Burkholderia cepacia]